MLVAMSDKPVLLRQKGSKESTPFEAGHATRLLAFPRTQWEKVGDEKPVAKSATTPSPAAKSKSKSATAKAAPAAAAPALPEIDATGQPNSI